MLKCKIYRVPCPYDSNKVYVVKRYGCGHYYLNEEIDGKLFYNRFVKTSRHWVNELLNFEVACKTETNVPYTENMNQDVSDLDCSKFIPEHTQTGYTTKGFENNEIL